jgi:hypothetical protein
MDSILTSDIFFFVTTLAVIIIAAAVVLIAYRLYRIIKKVEAVTDRLVLGFSSFEEFIKKLPFLKGLVRTKRRRKRTSTPRDA